MNPWMRAFALDWLVILAAYKAAFLWLPWWQLAFVVAVLVVGNRQHAIAILGHDGTHGHASRRATWWAFFPLGIDRDAYFRFHIAHHFHVGTKRDPETPFLSEAFYKFSWRNVWRDLAGFNALTMMRIWKAAGGEHWRSAFTLAVFLIIDWRFALVWQVAFLTSFAACFRQRAISDYESHHGRQIKAAWWHKLLFVPHNSWAHAEHHAKPGIPFYKLGKTAY